MPYTNYTLTFADQLSWVKESHTVKFGVEVRPIRMYTDRLGGTTYTFSNLNDLLNNTPSSVQVIGDVSAPNPLHGGATGNRFLKQTYYIGYAQDEWKIRPNLTMNYGLRYEYYSPLHEDRNLFTFFDMNTGDAGHQPQPRLVLAARRRTSGRGWRSPGRRTGSTTTRCSASAPATTTARARPKTRCSRSTATA